jgi:hypothetical protein
LLYSSAHTSMTSARTESTSMATVLALVTDVVFSAVVPVVKG